jgi:hypothetical protein
MRANASSMPSELWETVAARLAASDGHRGLAGLCATNKTVADMLARKHITMVSDDELCDGLAIRVHCLIAGDVLPLRVQASKEAIPDKRCAFSLMEEDGAPTMRSARLPKYLSVRPLCVTGAMAQDALEQVVRALLPWYRAAEVSPACCCALLRADASVEDGTMFLDDNTILSGTVMGTLVDEEGEPYYGSPSPTYQPQEPAYSPQEPAYVPEGADYAT